MPSPDDTIRSLRDALRHSPTNVPLRLHLARSLAGLGRLEEAEDEFRQALAQAPNDDGAKLGLAEVYFQQDKNTHALVIVEDLLKRLDTPPAAYMLHARLLLRAGDAERAVHQYR